MTADNIENDAPFNMASLYYINLAKLDERCLQMKWAGSLQDYKDALEDKMTYVSWNFNKPEIDNINKKFDAVQKKIDQISMIKLHANIQSVKKRQILAGLLDIDGEIWKLRKKYKMTFPRIIHNTGLESLAKKYKVQ